MLARECLWYPLTRRTPFDKLREGVERWLDGERSDEWKGELMVGLFARAMRRREVLSNINHRSRAAEDCN